MEEYSGVKFKTKEIEYTIPNKRRDEFLELDKLSSKFIKTKSNEGNLSMKMENGFLIKKAGAKMTELKKEDVIFVSKIENGEIYCSGGTPSSESLMHYLIYKNRKDAKIILHFHDLELLKKKMEFETGPFEYGTKELAESVSELSKKTDIIKIKEHGFVIIANNERELEETLGKMKM